MGDTRDMKATQEAMKEAKIDLLDKIKSLTNPIDDEINSLKEKIQRLESKNKKP